MNSDSDWTFVGSGGLLAEVGATMISDWTFVDTNRCFAIAKFGFYPAEDLQGKFSGTLTTLHLGDKVKIKAENGNWVLILNLSSLLTGLVPKSYLFEAPFETHPYSSTHILRPKRAAALQESADVLQEWHQVLVRRYLSHNLEYQQNQWRFKHLESRRQRLQHKNTTSDGRKKIQKEIGAIIDEGNKQLKLDVRARNPDGTELQPGSMPMVEYFQRYREWSQGTAAKTKEDVDCDFKNHHPFFFYVTVPKIFVGAVPDHGLKFFLYDGKAEITESASLYITDQLQTPLKILFSDLDTTDTNRDELYLAATIFRYGPIEAGKMDNSGIKLRIPCGAALSNITHLVEEMKHNDHCSGYMTYFPLTDSDKCLRSILERNRALANYLDDPPLQWRIKFEMSSLTSSSEASFVTVRKMDFPSVLLPTYTRNDLYITLEKGVFQKGSVEVTVTMHDGTEGLLNEPQKYKETTDQSRNAFTSSVYPRDFSPEWFETFAISLPDTAPDLASAYLRFTFTCRDTVKATNAKPFAFAFLPLHRNGATAIQDGSHNLAVYRIDHRLNDITVFANSGLQSLKASSSSKNHTPALSFHSKSSFAVKTKLCSTKFTQDERLCTFFIFKTNAINLDEADHSVDIYKNLLDLKLVLSDLRNVPDMEFAKFLQQILEKLFHLSGNLSNHNIGYFEDHAVGNMQQVSLQCDTEIFLCLVRIFDMVRKDRFKSFASTIDYYRNRSFSAGLACKKLVHTLVVYLLRFPKHQFSGMILEVINSTEMLFKFVVQSYKLLNTMMSLGVIPQEQSLHTVEFSTLIAEYFRALEKILDREENDNVRASILETIPLTMKVLVTAVPCWRLINHWSDLVKLVQKQNSLEALEMLQKIVDSSLFREHDARTTILGTLASSILPHLTLASPNSNRPTAERPVQVYVNAEESERNPSEPDVANSSLLPIDQVVLTDRAVKLLGNVVTKLHRTDIGLVEDNILYLIQTILKPIIATVIEMTSTGGSWGQIFGMDMVSILLSFFSVLKAPHYKRLCRSWGREERGHSSSSIPARTGLQGFADGRGQLALPRNDTQRERSVSPGRPARTFLSFVETVSTCFQQLYLSEHFPAAWCDMTLFQNKIILQVLHALAELLNSEFSEHFQMSPWLAFFECATGFVTQPSLQLEQFSTAKVCRIIQRFGDMRAKAAELVLNMWRSLETSKKRQFFQGKDWTILQPLLQMTLVSEPNIRAYGIPVFFDMIREEFRISVPSQNFKQVEKQFIQNLTDSVVNGEGDEGEGYIEIFEKTMLAFFNEDETGIRDQGLLFIKTVKRFFLVLLDLRKTSNESNSSNRMTCYMRLMELCEEIGYKDLYIRYLYKLYKLQKQELNFTEAAFVLGRHCQMLNWSEEPLVSYLNSKLHPSAVTHRELKEALYEDRILNLQNAQMYECALDLCNELYHLYGQETYEYDKLQNILQQMINLMVKLIDERKSTPQPTYFRVGFYGGGFPAFLRDKEYIYRGRQFELPADFESRILDMYPHAEMIRNLSPPSKEIIESDKQYLQVFDVKPVPNVCPGLPTASPGIIRYYSRNRVDRFTFDRRMLVKNEDDSDNEFARLGLKRTTYTVSFAFPGILNWFPVIASCVNEIRPIEYAIEFLQGFKSDLRTLIVEQHQAFNALGKYTCTKNLQAKLRAVLESDVQGGIPNYEKAFLTSAYLDKNPADMENVLKLKDCIISLAPIIKAGLEIHGKAAKEAASMQIMLVDQFSVFCDHIFDTYRVNAELLYDSQLQKVVAKYSKRILAANLLVEPEDVEVIPEVPATMEPIPERALLTRTTSSLSLGGDSRGQFTPPTLPLHPRRQTQPVETNDVSRAVVL